MFAIKVDDLYFGMPTDSKVVFELNNAAFEEDVIPGSLTFPNNFATTPTNDLIFRHARVLDVYSKVKSVDGHLYLLGSYFDKCKIVRLENSKDVYRCSIILNGINIDIQSKTLRDIDFSRHNKSFEFIGDALAWMAQCNNPENPEQAVVWPVMKNEIAFDDIKDNSRVYDYFNGTLNPWLSPTEYSPQVAHAALLNCPRYFTTPKIRVAAVLEALFNQFGYSVTGSFINDPEHRKLTMFSNKLFKMDSGALTQASGEYYDGSYSGNLFFPWHYPPLRELNDPGGHDPMDQDYHSRIGVFINNTMDVQYPHDLVKIKVLSGRVNRVVIRVKMSQMTTGPLQIGFFAVGLELNGTGGVIDGEVAYQVTNYIAVNESSETYTFVQDIDLDSISFLPNYFSSIAIFPVLAPGDDLTVEWITMTVVDLDYADPDFIEPFNLADFLPNQPIDEFLKATKQGFNLAFNFDWATNTVVIDKCISSLEAPVERIDERIGDDLPAKTLDIKGYDFSWDFSKSEDKLVEENFKTFPAADFLGYFQTTYPTGPDGKYFISLVNNKVFKISFNQEGVIQYNVHADAFYNVVTGDGSKKIIPSGMSPVLMSTVGSSSFTLCPNIQTSMHFPRFGLEYSDYAAIRLSYYRGLCQKVGSSDLVPVASSMNVSNVAGAPLLGKYLLTWDDKRSEGIYNMWWKKWESFMRNTERIRDRIYLDLPFIQSIFKKQKAIQNTAFIPGKLTFTISESGIEDGEIELYRNNFQFDPDGK